MEKILVTLLVLCAIALLLYIAWVLYSRILANKLMREGRNKKNFLFTYMSLRFSRLNIVNDAKLLIRDRSVPGGKLLADLGLVFVNRGGIFIIENVRGSGIIDVGDGGTWCRSTHDKQFFFEDPFIANGQKVKLMKSFLRSEKFDNIPVHGLVVCTGKKVKLTKKVSSLLTAPELADFIADANKDLILRRNEIRDVVKLIKSKQP